MSRPKRFPLLHWLIALTILNVAFIGWVVTWVGLTGRIPKYPNAQLVDDDGPDIIHYYSDLWIIFFYPRFTTMDTPSQVYDWYKRIGWSKYSTGICGDSLYSESQWHLIVVDILVSSSMTACEEKDNITEIRIIRDYHVCFWPCDLSGYSE